MAIENTSKSKAIRLGMDQSNAAQKPKARALVRPAPIP